LGTMLSLPVSEQQHRAQGALLQGCGNVRI
jgi:hypothetical protein